MRKKLCVLVLLMTFFIVPFVARAKELSGAEKIKSFENKKEEMLKEKSNKKDKKKINKIYSDIKNVTGTASGDLIDHDILMLPEIGRHPYYPTSDEYVTITEQAWVNITDHKIMTTNDVFEANKYYDYNALVIIDDNVNVFSNLAESPYALGWGGTSGFDSTAIIGASFYMGEEPSDYNYETVVLDIDNPTIGGHPVYAKNSSKYQIINEQWVNESEQKIMASTDVFEANKKYKYTVDFKTPYEIETFFQAFGENQYYLGERGTGTPGLTSTESAAFYFGDKSQLVIQTGEVTIAGDALPEVGQPLTYPSLSLGNNIDYSFFLWSKLDGDIYDNIEENEIAEVGKTYSYRLLLSAELGYQFAEGFEVVNNNKNNNVTIESTDCIDNFCIYEIQYKILDSGSTLGIYSYDNSIVYPEDKVNLNVYPNNEDNNSITWTSSNESVATISSNGEVTAITSGTTTITATNSKGETATYELEVGVQLESIEFSQSEIEIEEGSSQQLEIIFHPENATDKTIYWSSDDEDIAAIYDGVLYAYRAGTTTIYAYSPIYDIWEECEVTVTGVPKVKYTTHVQSYGWQGYSENGEMAGTTGEAKRLEAIKIKLEGFPYEGDIEYRTHIQTYGWEKEFKKNDEMSGTSGEAKRLEAIEIRLTGEMAEHYSVYYRVHAQKFGWLGWAKDGESSGTAGYAYRLEGIEILILPKDQIFDEYGLAAPFHKKLVKYTTHVQTYGWQDLAFDGQMAGTSGEAKRLEAIKIDLDNPLYSGNIEYKTHIQTYGWESSWKKNGAMSGTSGEAKRLEAIQIRLTGDMQVNYDVYYRVHAQHFGWLEWAKNGEKAGTAGFAYRLEGIEIVLVDKGDTPPQRDNQNDDRAFIQA